MKPENLLKPISITRPLKEKYRTLDPLEEGKEEFDKERLALKANILYVHGLASSGNSGTAKTIQKYLPKSKVYAPDLPLDPHEALTLLRKIIKEKNIDVVVGTSMGGMFAQKLTGVPKVLVNPAFHVSDSMRKKIGKNEFFKPRENGETTFEITEELCDTYRYLEDYQFNLVDIYEIENTYGLFGTEDDVVDCQKDFDMFYRNKFIFPGGHRLDDESVYNYVVEAILLLLKPDPKFGL